MRGAGSAGPLHEPPRGGGGEDRGAAAAAAWGPYLTPSLKAIIARSLFGSTGLISRW
jgi:hypothetical protein